jgi:hypothetical protein
MISKKYLVGSLIGRAWPSGLALLVCLASGGNALAYKVERVCETSEPTVKKPATKTCKTVLVRADGAGKDVKKEEKKEEKPAAGHH